MENTKQEAFVKLSNGLRNVIHSSRFIEEITAFEVVRSYIGDNLDINEGIFKQNNTDLDLGDIELKFLMEIHSRYEGNKKEFDYILNLIKQYDTRVIYDFIIYISSDKMGKGAETEMPKSLIKLISNLLIDNENLSFLNIRSGMGSLLNAISADPRVVETFGEEIDCRLYDIHAVFNKIFKLNANLSNVNSIITCENSEIDRIFTNMPFGLRIPGMVEEAHKVQKMNNMTISQTADQYYIQRTINSLSENGKAVVLVPNGWLFSTNRSQFEYRKYLIENNYIDAIISLPAKLFSSFSIPVTLLVLEINKKSNGIKLIDASNNYIKKSNRYNALSVENINNILENYANNENYIDIEDIIEKDYSLIPSRYSHELVFENSVSISELVEEVIVGKQFSKAILEKSIDINNKSNTQIIRLADIGNLNINYSELKFLKDDSMYRKYQVDRDYFVFSATGTVFKSSVIEKTNKSIIIDGTLIAIKFNKKYNPLYIKLFFDSELGKKLIDSISTGNATMSISRNNFLNLNIPFVDIENQNAIANKYKEYVEELNFLRQKENDIKKKIGGLL